MSHRYYDDDLLDDSDLSDDDDAPPGNPPEDECPEDPQNYHERDEYDATDKDCYEDEDNKDDEFIPTRPSHWEEQDSGGRSDDRPNDYDDDRQFTYDDDAQYEHENQEETYHEDGDHRDQECLFRCAARYKYGVICKSIFETEEDIHTHLVACHHTHKWLVHTFVKL